jgi:hypothetical protein
MNTKMIFLLLFFTSSSVFSQPNLEKNKISRGSLYELDSNINMILKKRFDSMFLTKKVDSFMIIANSNIKNLKYESDSILEKLGVVFLSSLLSLIVAIGAFLFSQHISKKKEKIQKEEKYLGFLKILKEEIKRNLDLECNLFYYLQIELRPAFSISFFIYEQLYSKIAEECLNHDLLANIFTSYYELYQIQKRLNQIDGLIKENKMLDAEYCFLGTFLLSENNIVDTFNLYSAIVNEINLKMVEPKKISIETKEQYLKEKDNYFCNNDDALKREIKKNHITINGLKKLSNIKQ